MRNMLIIFFTGVVTHDVVIDQKHGYISHLCVFVETTFINNDYLSNNL